MMCIKDRNNVITMRQLVCNKEGERSEKHLNRIDRKREAKAITRSNCKARLRIHLDYKSRKWIVSCFEPDHNHELTPASMVHLMPAYRGLSVADKAQVEGLHLYGVRTCHIMGLIMGQKGGYSDIGFCKKDLYNHIDKVNRAKIEDGDAFAALCYLQAKYDNNPMTFVKFTTTEDDRLENLFWADVGSRIDYICFGDVVAFDTTYKKNKYNRPLVIFCGYNHHGETTIFGCALVADEKTETYKWVLETFLEAMCNKVPKVVVTDGDGAMREAIRAVFPGALHRLCAWHLHQNACENVKNPKFLEDFKNLIYGNFTREKFEDEWNKVVEKHGVRENKWVRKVYQLKRMWATAYLRDHFFGGIRTTSICEGINSFIKSYVQSKNSLVDFLHNFERAVNEYRHNELTSDFKSTYTQPVMTTALEKYELEASNVYTRNKFFDVRKEIEKVAAINVIDKSDVGNVVTLRLKRFGSPDSENVVQLDKSNGNLLCDYRLFESCGILCSHIFTAMKHEQVESIPASLICKRWTKLAIVDHISAVYAEEGDTTKKDLMRSGAVGAACNRLNKAARRNPHNFVRNIESIHKLAEQMERQEGIDLNSVDMSRVVRDPTVVKTKGAPRKNKKRTKKMRCSYCKRAGHTVRTCTKYATRDQLDTVVEEESSVETNEDSRDQSVSVNPNFSREVNHV